MYFTAHFVPVSFHANATSGHMCTQAALAVLSANSRSKGFWDAIFHNAEHVPGLQACSTLHAKFDHWMPLLMMIALLFSAFLSELQSHNNNNK